MIDPVERATDRALYQQGDVVITATLARFGGVSYPINAIGSVFIEGPSFFRHAVPVILGACVIGFAYQNLSGWPKSAVMAVGVIWMAATLFAPSRLMLRTASGDQQAYESQDRKMIGEIKAAIEKAVTLRG